MRWKTTVVGLLAALAVGVGCKQQCFLYECDANATYAGLAHNDEGGAIIKHAESTTDEAAQKAIGIFERRWQNAKDDHLLVVGKIENHVCDIRWRPIAKHFTQRAEVSTVDQALYFWCEKFADHVVFLTFALAQSNGAALD